MNTLELKIPPLLLLILCAAFMWLLAVFVPIVLINFAGQLVIAILLAIVGAQIAIAGARACHERQTTVNPLTPEKSATLITDGVFKVSRNPIYLGLLLALIGFAVYLGALTAALVLPMFVWYMNQFQIKPEERSLAQQFGDSFIQYTQRTRRWL